uniref:Putative zinc finger protein n=1 Tax=Ixodes ricinus TaxID=34613 RepID=A0A0K8RIZ4_IXORI
MEPIQSSSLDDVAAQLGETSCRLKATEDIWFRCCSCIYFTRDQRGIVSHLVAHGDKQVKCHNPLSSSSRSEVHSTEIHRGDMFFKCNLCPQAFANDASLIETIEHTQLKCHSSAGFAPRLLL